MKWSVLLVIFCFVYVASGEQNISEQESNEQIKSYSSLCIKNERPDTKSGLIAEEGCLQEEAEKLRQKWNKLYNEDQISPIEQDWVEKEKALFHQRRIGLKILETKAMEDLSVLEQWVAKAILFVTDELLMPQFYQASNEAMMEFNTNVKDMLDTKSQELSPAQSDFKKWHPILEKIHNIEAQKEHLMGYWDDKKATFLTKKDKNYLLDNLLYIQFDMNLLQIDTKLMQLQNEPPVNIEQNNFRKQQLLKEKETIQILQKHCLALVQNSSVVSSNAKHKLLLQQKIDCVQQLL